MNNSLHNDILAAIRADKTLSFKESGKHFKHGRCPQCGRKSAFVSVDNPGRISCSHKDSCGWTETVRERYPHVFTELGQRHPATPNDPNATANAYMSHIRGFPLIKIGNWFTQGALPLSNKKLAPTVRFNLWDGYYWERLINQSDIDVWGDKNHNKRGLTYVDKCWQPPGFSLKKGDTVFIVEGIFHAIALTLSGFKAVAAFSSNVLPRELIKANLGKGITWALAYDNDENDAGNNAAIKFRRELRQLGEAVDIYQCPVGKDWDDIYREGRLDESFIAECLHRGRVNTAESITDKAYWIFTRNQYKHRVIEFGNRFHSVSVEDYLDVLSKAISEASQMDIEGKDDAELHGKAIDDAIKTHRGRSLFNSTVKHYSFSNCLPKFLYSQQDKTTGEIAYAFAVHYPSQQKPELISLSGSALKGPASFDEALMKAAPGATFDGTVDQLKKIREGWFDYGFKRVESVNFIGYDKQTGIYIFPDFAFHSGRHLRTNKSGYIDTGKTQLKTTLKSIPIKISKNFEPEWTADYFKAFSYNGVCVLGFFLGSLFAEQIRTETGFFPFLEFTGEPGAGKSTVLEFCWKLLGRTGYEGFNPSKATFASRARTFSQVSGMPIVLMEGDSKDGQNDAKKRGFDFEELKDAFNGRSFRTTGSFNRGNDIEESPFRGAVVIAQNREVDGSEALLSRIVHLHASKAHHGRETKATADWFRRVDLVDVSGFMFQALSHERQILDAIKAAYRRIDESYAKTEDLKHVRIIECHAMVAATVSALPLVLPKIDRQIIADCERHLYGRALIRQQRLQADHPLVQLFWEIYDNLNVRKIRGEMESLADLPGQERETLNHSKDAGFIAINLLEFKAEAEKARYGNLDVAELKNLLPLCRSRPFVAVKTVKSQLSGASKHCWVFKTSRNGVISHA